MHLYVYGTVIHEEVGMYALIYQSSDEGRILKKLKNHKLENVDSINTPYTQGRFECISIYEVK